jgi:hypothetical protein
MPDVKHIPRSAESAGGVPWRGETAARRYFPEWKC